MATCEFRLPIAAAPGFYSNVKLAALSLAALGPPYDAAPLTVFFGGDADPGQVRADNPWSGALPHLAWRAAPPVRVHPGFASGLARYSRPAEADVVVLMDADACLLRPIDDLLETLSSAQEPTVAALPAHASPFSHDGATNDAAWRHLLQDCGLADVPLDSRYYRHPDGYPGWCPPYFNYGFVAFNRAAFERVRPLLEDLTERMLQRYEGTPTAFYSAQLALTLALLQCSVRTLALDHAFNCPNSDEMSKFAPLAPDSIRVLHYLRTAEFDRHRFLCDPAAFDAFRRAAFAAPATREFQRHVLSLKGVVLETGNG